MSDWPRWEVFVRARRGLAHQHAGTVHAADGEAALRAARDLFTRRLEQCGVIGGVGGDHLARRHDPQADALLPAADKAYRFATSYDLPADVDHM